MKATSVAKWVDRSFRVWKVGRSNPGRIMLKTETWHLFPLLTFTI